MIYSRWLPDPETFSVDDVKKANATSWRLLAVVAAGLPIADICAEAPDREDREVARAVLQKGFEIHTVEAIDEVRAILGPEARSVRLDVSVENYVRGLREMVTQGLPGLGLREMVVGASKDVRVRAEQRLAAISPIQGEILTVFSAMIFAWDVLQLCRKAGDRALTAEEIGMVARDDPDGPSRSARRRAVDH